MEKCKKIAFLRFSLYYLSIFSYFFVCVHSSTCFFSEKWRVKSEEWKIALTRLRISLLVVVKKISIDKNKERYFSLFFPYFYLLIFCLLWFLSAWYCLPDSPPRHALIPRLRPGLLSLRSVLSSRQVLVYSFAFDFLVCSFAFGSFAMFKIYHG